MLAAGGESGVWLLKASGRCTFPAAGWADVTPRCVGACAAYCATGLPVVFAVVVCLLCAVPTPCCRAYVAGRLQPGPFHLVAPFFKFPPIACPPPLDAIPESVTPTSSTQDLSGVSDPSRESDSAADTPTSGSSGGFSAQSQHQQPLLEVGGGFNLPSAWIAPACGDAEEGGAASS